MNLLRLTLASALLIFARLRANYPTPHLRTAMAICGRLSGLN